jgi:DNA-binding SARP family transcriptional activator
MYRPLLCVAFCLTLTLLSLSPCTLGAQGDPEYGLWFTSHEQIKDNRTGLALAPEEGLRLEGDFRFSFDVRFREAVHTFGYVFRMISGAGSNLDMVSDISIDEPKLIFTEGSRTVAEFPIGDGTELSQYNKWIHVTVEGDPETDRLILSVDSLSRSVPLNFNDSHFQIWFGVCEHPAFYTTDVPPMSLRDVRIEDGRSRHVLHWKLGRHAGDTVWDEEGRHPAHVKNPVWLLDGYAHWHKKISTLVPEENLGMAAREDGRVIYFAAGDHLAVYDNSDAGSFEVRRTANRMPFAVQPNQIVFDEARGLVVAYEFESQSTATLAPDAGELSEWSAATAQSPVPRYWHHTAAYLPSIDRIVTFGGYGEHIYKSRINVIGPDGEWTSFEQAQKLSPRYLSGMVATPDGQLLIAGGYGNLSGLQSESPHNFYDIWRVDPIAGKVERVGELARDKEEEHFVLGRDMILADDGQRLYALTYSDKRYASEIRLVGISLPGAEMTRYADAVPYQFSDIESFCTLVFDRTRQEFLLVTLRRQSPQGTLVEIWSLGAPPLRIADTVQASPEGGVGWWWIALPILALIGAGGMAVVVRRLRKRQVTAEVENSAVVSSPVPDIPDYKKTYRIDKQPSSILLLGGFQVVDKNGKDITGHFTRTVRALFLLILLETYKNGRGISSQALGDLLWFDKDPENARNNRNVNIHKLRTLLSEVGVADVSSSNSYWHLTLGDDIFCDYSSLLQLGREVASSEGDFTSRVESLVALASLGKLMPNIQTEWSDAYKADFSARLIELLMKTASAPEIKNSPQLLLRIAEAILIHDNLDEDAMRMKCSALVRMGKRNQAKQAYNTFAADFRKTLDTSPDFIFPDSFPSDS